MPALSLRTWKNQFGRRRAARRFTTVSRRPLTRRRVRRRLQPVQEGVPEREMAEAGSADNGLWRLARSRKRSKFPAWRTHLLPGRECLPFRERRAIADCENF